MPLDIEEIKGLIETQGTAFDAFKKTIDEQVVELKKGVKDPVLADRLAKIETSLDSAAEAKAQIEAGLNAERKEREDLELRLNRMGKVVGDEKKAVALADFTNLITARWAERSKSAPAVDEKIYDAYLAAEAKYLRGGDKALSGDETKVLSIGSDPDGGYYVTPDTSGRMVKRVYETSPIRQISSAMTISTQQLDGIEDLGEAGVGYAGELAQGSDTTTPQVGKWSIPVYNLDTMPKATQNLLDDANVDVEGWLANKVASKFGRFENAEFVTGAAKIRGFTSYTMAADSGAGVTWGTVGFTNTGTSGGFAATNGDNAIYDLIGLLKNDYLPNARFVTRRAIITAVRKMKDANGMSLWQPSMVLGNPEVIAGYPLTRAEDIPALAANSFSLWFGDFKEAYQIVDRQGIRVMRDPFTNKPFILFYTTKRTGGGLVNFEAIKALKFI